MNVFKKKKISGCWLENFFGRFLGHFVPEPWLHTAPVQILCFFLSLSGFQRETQQLLHGLGRGYCGHFAKIKPEQRGPGDRLPRGSGDGHVVFLSQWERARYLLSGKGGSVAKTAASPACVLVALLLILLHQHPDHSRWGWGAHVVHKPSRERNKNKMAWFSTEGKIGESIVLYWLIRCPGHLSTS